MTDKIYFVSYVVNKPGKPPEFNSGTFESGKITSFHLYMDFVDKFYKNFPDDKDKDAITIISMSIIGEVDD